MNKEALHDNDNLNNNLLDNIILEEGYEEINSDSLDINNHNSENINKNEDNSINDYVHNESDEDEMSMIYEENNISSENYNESNYITENYDNINNTNKLTKLLIELNLDDKTYLDKEEDSGKDDNWFKKNLKKRIDIRQNKKAKSVPKSTKTAKKKIKSYRYPKD